MELVLVELRGGLMRKRLMSRSSAWVACLSKQKAEVLVTRVLDTRWPSTLGKWTPLEELVVSRVVIVY